MLKITINNIQVAARLTHQTHGVDLGVEGDVGCVDRKPLSSIHVLFKCTIIHHANVRRDKTYQQVYNIYKGY